VRSTAGTAGSHGRGVGAETAVPLSAGQDTEAAGEKYVQSDPLEYKAIKLPSGLWG